MATHPSSFLDRAAGFVFRLDPAWFIFPFVLPSLAHVYGWDSVGLVVACGLAGGLLILNALLYLALYWRKRLHRHHLGLGLAFAALGLAGWFAPVVAHGF